MEEVKMSIFKCKMCGGTIETYGDNEVTAECKFCGTNQTLPKSYSNNTIYLYNRANHFCRSKKFDKAMPIYMQILGENYYEAESYWSVLLCRYGISYNYDVSKYPIVSRINYVSIFEDDDYKSAVKYAEPAQRKIYQAEAKIIDDMQKKLSEISEKIKPFDVFICCREKDSKYRDTPESFVAKELYNILSNEGFNVFLSGITLDGKPKEEHIAYIHSAVVSAKAMVVLGTKSEFFNETTVRNQWLSYLEIIKNNKSKILIPCYDEMSPSKLPEEFIGIKSYDMSENGFTKNIIEKIENPQVSDISKKVENKKNDIKEQYSQNAISFDKSNVNIKAMIDDAFNFLKKGYFESAETYCKKVLDIDITNEMAYLGCLMAELKVREKEMLKDCTDTFSGNQNYKNILKYGSNSLKEELASYVRSINQRNMNIIFEKKYEMAYNLYIEGKSNKSSLIKAKRMFELLYDYKDSEKLAEKCDEIINEINYNQKHEKALNIYEEAEKFYNRASADGSLPLAVRAADKLKEAEAAFMDINDDGKFDEIINECQNKKALYSSKCEELQKKVDERAKAAEKMEKIKNIIKTSLIIAGFLFIIIFIIVNFWKF